MRYPARQVYLILFAAIAWQPALPQGGSVTVVPTTLGDAERAYFDAQNEWLYNDPKLVADLLKGNPQEMHRRIRKAAELREQVMEKKTVYLDLILKHFNDTRALLVSSPGAQLPVPVLRQNLEDEQSRILTEIDRVDAMIRDLPQDDRYTFVVHELNTERTQLVNLQITIAQQIKSINTIGSAQDGANKMEAASPLAAKLDAVTKMWQEERNAIKIQREHFKAYYDSMDKLVDCAKNPKSSAACGPNGTPASPAGGSATKPRIVPPQGARDWNRDSHGLNSTLARNEMNPGKSVFTGNDFPERTQVPLPRQAS